MLPRLHEEIVTLPTLQSEKAAPPCTVNASSLSARRADGRGQNGAPRRAVALLTDPLPQTRLTPAPLPSAAHPSSGAWGQCELGSGSQPKAP